MILCAVAGPKAQAQAQGDVSGNPQAAAALNQGIQGIERSYAEQLEQQQRQLQAAQFQLSQCATEEGNTKAQAKAQDTQAMAGALSGIVSGGLAPSAGNVVGALLSDAGNEKVRAKALMEQIPKQVDDVNKTYGGSVLQGPDRTTGIIRSAPGARNAIEAYCENQKGIGHQPEAKPGESPTDFSIRENAWSNKITRCTSEAKSNIDSARSEFQSQYQEAQRNFKGGSDLTSATTTMALQTTVASVGSGLQLWGQHAGTKAQLQNAAAQRASCEQQAKALIDQTNRAIARLEKQKADDILSATLQAAAAAQNQNPISKGLGSPGIGVGTGQDLGSGKSGFDPSKFGNNAANNGAGGGGGGGGGGGAPDAGNVAWNFGGGKEGPAGGGGLPQQPDAASYSGDGGGGGGFGGGFGSGLPTEDPSLGQKSVAEVPAEAGPAFGDGGIAVLIARARMRYAHHAAELVRSIDLKTVSQKQPEAPQPDRAPASSLPAGRL